MTRLPPPPGKETARLVGWALVFDAAVQLAGYVLARNALGATAVQAAIAEWGAGRMAIAWSDPNAKVPTWQALVRRAASGAGLGFGVGALVLVVLLVSHGAALATTAPVPTTLAMGLLVAPLTAVRDELLLRGYVLRVLNGWPSPAVGAVVCGLASAAVASASPDVTPVAIAVAFVSGVAFAALWQKDRGAWMAVGAHAAWQYATHALIDGGLLDVRFAPTVWGGGDGKIEGSATALAVLVPIALAAVVWAARDVTRQNRP